MFGRGVGGGLNLRPENLRLIRTVLVCSVPGVYSSVTVIDVVVVSIQTQRGGNTPFKAPFVTVMLYKFRVHSYFASSVFPM